MDFNSNVRVKGMGSFTWNAVCEGYVFNYLKHCVSRVWVPLPETLCVKGMCSIT